jgi:hypothetical protein
MVQRTIKSEVLTVPIKRSVGAPIQCKNLKTTLSAKAENPIYPLISINFLILFNYQKRYYTFALSQRGAKKVFEPTG